MRVAALAFVLLVNAPLPAAERISIVLRHFDLDITVDYEEERIDGTARLTIENAGDASVVRVPLLLHRLMTVKGVSAADGGKLAFEQDVVLFADNSRLQVVAAEVSLASPLAPGKSTTIAIDYGGHLVGYAESGMRYVKDHVGDGYTMIREDAFAFPAIGRPSHRVNRARPRRDFTFDARIIVPATHVVAAGGTLASKREESGRATHHFTSSVPVPFLNIGIAKFKQLDDAGVRIYFLGEEAGAKMVMERTRKALELFGQWFGPLARPPELTIIEIPDGYGPQASLGAGILLESKVFGDPDSLFSLYHEVGHFWNVPDRDVPSSRWNEGLSTWFQEIVPMAIDQKSNPRFAPWIADRTVKAIGRDERLTRVPLKDYGKEEMTDYSYSVGYLYFHILEKAIGREQLLGVLRDYFQENQSRGATLRAFLTLLEKRHPKARAIDADWIESAAWSGKLAAAKSLEDLAASY